jgi:hypothetical protein
MSIKEELSKALLSKKEFTESTLRTYTSLLSSLYNKLDGDKDGLEFFTKQKESILEHIGKMSSAQSKKTILSALFKLTEDDDYKTHMMENIKVVNNHYSQRKTDEKRKEKAKPWDEIRSLCETFIAKYQENKSIYNLMNVLISTLCSGYYESNPPRRLMDYSEMKLKNFSNEDNYVKGNYFYFNKYKTSKVNEDNGKGRLQKVEIAKELRPLINKLKKENLSDYLLLNVKGEKFSQSSLNKRLTLLFGFGCDMLRSIYLSDHVYSNDLLKKLEKTAEDMGHSVDAAMNFYVKDK